MYFTRILSISYLDSPPRDVTHERPTALVASSIGFSLNLLLCVNPNSAAAISHKRDTGSRVKTDASGSVAAATFILRRGDGLPLPLPFTPSIASPPPLPPFRKHFRMSKRARRLSWPVSASKKNTGPPPGGATCAAYRARALQGRALAHRIMATIRSKDIANFRREREEEGVSGNTIRLDFALLSKLFNHARSDWGMESLQNPVQLAAKPKPSKGRDRRLENDEEERILRAAKPPFDSVIRFALETAIRREEIASLKCNYLRHHYRQVKISKKDWTLTKLKAISSRHYRLI